MPIDDPEAAYIARCVRFMERFGWTEQEYLNHDASFLKAVDDYYEAKHEATEYLKESKK